MSAAEVLGLSEKTTSCFLTISFTISEDETTRVGTWPICKSINGPYLAKSVRSEWCGWVLRRRRLPISGNLGGDGGKLNLVPAMVLKKRKNQSHSSYQSPLLPTPDAANIILLIDQIEPVKNRLNLQFCFGEEGSLILWRKLALQEKIGSGSFGTDYRAKWRGSVSILHFIPFHP
uniref:Uncharacterized protein n=1 Tax=Cannabis sativa TaxID=3483 RepID=A0A803NWS8_CANSA